MPERASATLQSAIEQGLTICLDSNCLIFYFNGDQPWTENLRPVFEAKDQGKIRLITSTVTLAEVLAKKESYQHSQLLNTVQRYFDVIPVSSNIGVYAAGIRQNYGRVKTPDALEMATASETGAILFITNDEQLVDKSLDRCQALYLKNLAIDWLEDEFQACIDTSQTVISLSRGSTTLNLEIDLFVDSRNPLPSLQTPRPAADFPLLALKLSQLIAGSVAVVGIVEGLPGQDGQLIALRLLPAGRPWLMPKVPDWIGQFTGKVYTLHELETVAFVESVANAVDSFNQSCKDKGQPERRTLFLLADVSLADAESAVKKMDGIHQMLPHHKRIEIWRRYLAPFRPLASLWMRENARLWRGEASNAHHLDIARFHNFFSMAGNVLGERSLK
jgi:predicted nucleic acid-binding protein